MNDQSRQEDKNTQGRRERLSTFSASGASAHYNPAYSRFIRRMKLILPLVAIIIAAVVFTWSTGGKDIPAITDLGLPPTIGKNELLNPRFESQDEKKQPYTITAKRAVQGETNENLVILEEPLADMLLSSGQWIAVKAEQGAYLQDTRRLLLKGAVELYHDEGYEMHMALLNVDMKENTAWTDVDVFGRGPEGTLEAKGLKANSVDGTVVFNGPAKLVLNTGKQNLGGMFGGKKK